MPKTLFRFLSKKLPLVLIMGSYYRTKGQCQHCQCQCRVTRPGDAGGGRCAQAGQARLNVRGHWLRQRREES